MKTKQKKIRIILARNETIFTLTQTHTTHSQLFLIPSRRGKNNRTLQNKIVKLIEKTSKMPTHACKQNKPDTHIHTYKQKSKLEKKGKQKQTILA